MDMTGQDESSNVIDSRKGPIKPIWTSAPEMSHYITGGPSPGVGGAISDAIDAVKKTINAFRNDPGHEDTRVSGNETSP